MLYRVVTSSKSPAIGNGLTYSSSDTKPLQGYPVRVPLRKTLVEGIVVEVLRDLDRMSFDVKEVTTIVGERPLLTEAQLKTASWMAEYYCSTLRQSVGLWLPPPPWDAVFPREIAGYRLLQETAALRGKKQLAIVDALRGRDWVSIHELHDEFGSVQATLKGLLEQGIVQEEKRIESSSTHSQAHGILTQPTLTPDQRDACDAIRNARTPSLLFGITGSGKTEVYAQLIAETIRSGKQALLLVPEILLTEHSIKRFERLVSRSLIAVIHSKLTVKERRDLWIRIARGEIALVIGSRSALFSPLHKLGLIVVDEEHEWTYKNEQSPRYHVRETAEVLARHSGASLVFGSATPSLEAWSKTKSGAYALARLPRRYLDQSLPHVTVVDLATVTFGKVYPFSPTLLTAIQERLKRGEQSVLFLNRRGTATAVLCRACRRRIVSPESQLPYSVHDDARGRPYLLDHTTGSMAAFPSQCPSCRSTDLLSIGAGTQRIEGLLRSIFPKARLIRADSDTLESAEDMRSLLSRMESREADILLGTQSVVKGLDLPGVTLAAVLIADVGLSLPHFRSGERIFQLLTQLTGRSGRAAPGEVIIQTFRPDAPEVVAASMHDTEKYLEDELKLRLHAGYPPASKMVRLILRGTAAESNAKMLGKQLRQVAEARHSDTHVSFAPTFFGGGKIWHVLLRGSAPRTLLTDISLEGVTVDIDPLDTV